MKAMLSKASSTLTNLQFHTVENLLCTFSINVTYAGKYTVTYIMQNTLTSLTSFSLSSTGLPTNAIMRILWFLPCLCFSANYREKKTL